MSRRLTIEEMQALAAKKGGKCLSTQYIKSKTKLKWQCAKGHTWMATPASIKNYGSWCRECHINKKFLTITEMQALAAKKRGKCLSTQYINAHTKLKWQCAEGHIWEATPSAIKNVERWCPKCKINYSEELCRVVFEQLFDAKFLNCRPDWLIYTNGSKLELDGYCEHLKIAFEYQGMQHYRSVNFGGEHHTNLRDQKDRDEYKAKCCFKNDVSLFIISYKDDLTALPNLIKTQADELELNLSHINFDQIIDFNRVYEHKTKIEEMQALAAKKDGKCLSTQYIGALTKLEWQCAEGHTWMAIPDSIKNCGTWCPSCAGTTISSIEEMQALAAKKGGKCLSTQYINTNTKLKWQCARGHTFMAIPVSVKNQGTWCPSCAGNARSSIEEMQALAAKKGGKCLSTQYINSKTKLKWQCAKGHTWMRTPEKFKYRGSWCPSCQLPITKAKLAARRLSIEEMQALAAKKGGKCLSTQYIGVFTKLKWQCAEGHTWMAIPDSIKNCGTWCPSCAGTTISSIEEMQALAAKKGGKCLSTQYINTNTKLKWQCARGHTFMAIPVSVKNQGTWCPSCAGNARSSIEEMQALAAKKGGKCLSTQYINSKTKLKWQCAEGHIWEARPNDIKHGGTWCPECNKN